MCARIHVIMRVVCARTFAARKYCLPEPEPTQEQVRERQIEKVGPNTHHRHHHRQTRLTTPQPARRSKRVSEHDVCVCVYSTYNISQYYAEAHAK